MSNPLPPFEILMPGTFTSAEGDTVSFSDAELQGIVSSYDASAHPAPIVVGHPTMDAPAYGWIDGLSIEGGRIVARSRDLEQSFAEAVSAGRYRKVSASLYPPAHPANPTPGQYALKHVGFLGAHAPGVKGLRPVSFSEAQQAGCITIETTDQEIAMTEKKAEEAKTLEFAEREAALTERETRIKAEEARIAEEAAKARRAEALSFAEGLVSANKLLPAGKANVAIVLEHLDATKTISLGEGLGEITPAQAFRKLFDGAVPAISFGELSKRDPDDDDADDGDVEDIASRARSFADAEAKAGRTVSAQAAVRHVMKSKGA